MSTKAKILIVEDEKDISDLIASQLMAQGFETLVLSNGNEALELIQENQSGPDFDLFILDRMLPGATGLEICKFLRVFRPTKGRPILMLTALTKPEQIIEGLDAGADDYITKPFDMNILMARVRSLLRRMDTLSFQKQNPNLHILKIKDLKIDTNQCKVWNQDQEIDLTLSEYKLLVAFMQQPGKVLTRNQLVEFIQDGPVHVTDRTVDTHIFGLRKKLKENAGMIETIRGIGYRVINEEI